MQDRKNKYIQGEKLEHIIPDKLYFAIGEVAKLCDLKAHVLRYWEQEFPQLSPSKRRGNRRYYQRKDVILILQIKNLLYEKGFTIEGARAQLGKERELSQKINSINENDSLNKAIKHLEEVLLLLED